MTTASNHRAPVPVERKLLRYEMFRTAAVWLGATCAVIALGVVLLANGAAQDARSRLLSCTDPGNPEPNVRPSQWAHPPGTCYARSQRAQAGIIGEPAGGINTVVVAAAACARAVVRDDDPESVAQARTLACTQRSLADGTAPAR